MQLLVPLSVLSVLRTKFNYSCTFSCIDWPKRAQFQLTPVMYILFKLWSWVWRKSTSIIINKNKPYEQIINLLKIYIIFKIAYNSLAHLRHWVQSFQIINPVSCETILIWFNYNKMIMTNNIKIFTKIKFNCLFHIFLNKSKYNMITHYYYIK